MSNLNWEQLWKLFDQALELPESDRSQFMDRSCRNDPELRGELEKLLAAHVLENQILDEPVEATVQFEASTQLERVGEYRIIRLLGRGGMGEVYLGRRDDEEFEQDVAIKISPYGRYSEPLLQRFRVERQILANLNHPQIARLFGGGTTAEGVPYLVMEFIDGEPIDVYCSKHRLGLADRLRLFFAVCEAVHFAHQQLVVHLDIKPSNVLVNEAGQPKLLDFGVARLLDPDNVTRATTAALGRMATPEYASPEQVKGEPLSTASDVYSLGVLLYQLVTDQRPYEVDSKDLAGTLKIICQTQPPPPSEALSVARVSRRVRRLRGDLDNIVMKAMRKEPERRYASAEQLANDIHRHLTGQPVRARPETVGYRSAKFVRRHPFGVTAGALFVLLLAAFGGTAAYQAAQLRNALHIANLEKEKSDQVANFMQDLFQESDPWKRDQQDITVRGFLDEGAKRVRNELADQPEVQAALMKTLAGVYGRLNEFESAGALARDAVAVSVRVYGQSNQNTWEAELELAKVLVSTDQNREAAQLLDDMLDRMAEAESQEQQFEASVRTHYAIVLRLLGRFEEALSEGRSALAIRRKELGGQHELTADALRIVATTLAAMDRLDEATSIQQQVYEIWKQTYGPDHPITNNALASIAQTQFYAGEYADALDNFQVVLQHRLEKLGRFHTQVGYTLNLIGVLHTRRGEYLKAETALLDAIEIQREVLGRDSKKVSMSVTNLALVYNETERYAEALALYEEALRIDISTLGKNHPDVGIVYNNVGLVHQDMGDMAKAAKSFRAAYAIFLEAWGPDHSRLGYSLNNLAIVLHDAGAHEEAETKFKEALRVRTLGLDSDHPALGATLHEYGRYLIDRGRLEEAAPMIDQALSIRRAKLSEGDWRTAHTEVLKGELLARNGDPTSAVALMAPGVEQLKISRGLNHWRTRDALIRLDRVEAIKTGDDTR